MIKMLIGRIINLRQLEEYNMDACQDMINDQTMTSWVVSFSFLVFKSGQQEWFVKDLHDFKNKRFVITDKKNDALGIVTLSNIVCRERSVILEIKLHLDTPQKKGVEIDALKVLIHYVFVEIKINRMNASWIFDNIASKKTFSNCGFRVEGRLRKAIFRNDKYKDLVLAGMLQKEYL